MVLTIAHMDQDESHADPSRCRALCQRCHNEWDAPHRQINAARTRRQKSPQLDIEDYLESLDKANAAACDMAALRQGE